MNRKRKKESDSKSLVVRATNFIGWYAGIERSSMLLLAATLSTAVHWHFITVHGDYIRVAGGELFCFIVHWIFIYSGPYKRTECVQKKKRLLFRSLSISIIIKRVVRIDTVRILIVGINECSAFYRNNFTMKPCFWSGKQRKSMDFFFCWNRDGIR